LNLISIGSIVQGIHRIPTPMASTKAKHGNPRKSTWTTTASWFSNTPDKQEALNNRPRSRTKVAAGRGSCTLQSAIRDEMNGNERLRPSNFSFLDFQHFSFYQKSPLFPRNPLFPFPDRLSSVFSALGEKANS
jgi:hypothetical protein